MRTKNFRLSGGFSSVAILIIAVVVVLSLVAVLAFKNIQISKQPPTAPRVVKDAQVSALESQSTSDEIGVIDQDANATKLDNIDEGVDQIEKDISAAQ